MGFPPVPAVVSVTKIARGQMHAIHHRLIAKAPPAMAPVKL